jgi:hypothetical protein
MASRSDYDYSMWPEHVRPRRRHISLKLLACVFATGAVCAIAVAAVLAEFAPASLSQAASQATGRSWPVFSPAEDSRAAGTLAPRPALQEVAVTPVAPAEAAAVAETTGSASSRAAKPTARATRPLTLPTIGTSHASTPDAAAKTEPAKPAPATTEAAKTEPAKTEAVKPAPAEQQTEAALRKELDAASETKPAAVDKPKPRKKARKRVEPAYGTAEVYQYPDGRRVTVIRRPDNPAFGSGYGRPTYQAYPGRPGYYQ